MFWRLTLPPILTLVGAPLHLQEPNGDLFVPLENQADIDFLVDLSRFASRKRLPIRTWKIYLGPTHNWARRVQNVLVLNEYCQNLEIYCLPDEGVRLGRLIARHRVSITIHGWSSSVAGSQSTV